MVPAILNVLLDRPWIISPIVKMEAVYGITYRHIHFYCIYIFYLFGYKVTFIITVYSTSYTSIFMSRILINLRFSFVIILARTDTSGFGQPALQQFCKMVRTNLNLIFFTSVYHSPPFQVLKIHGKVNKKAQIGSCSNVGDSDINLPEYCLQEIWIKCGCITNVLFNRKWWITQPKNVVEHDMALWANVADDEHRVGCYGHDKSNWPTLK